MTVDDTLIKDAVEIADLLGEMGLYYSQIEAQRFSEFFKGKDSVDGDELAQKTRVLSDRMRDELEMRRLLVLSEAESKLLTEPEPYFGAKVNDRFSKAIDDIEDAKKCAALGQGTASVMHLMRIMEIGLKEIASGLGIPYAPSWESYLSQIQSNIALNHKKKTTKWKSIEKFYRDVSGDLISVKQAWRNPTMHIERRYSPEEAREIMASVKTFMQRLADGLPPLKPASLRRNRI